MKKIILLMSFIVLTTIAHAFNYGSITVYQDGKWCISETEIIE